MTFDDIKTFIQLAQSKNFSRTAEILYISQSTVSSRIKNLEQQLDHPLFIRDSKNVKLTPAGLDFYNYAVQLDRLWNESRETLRSSGKYDCQITIAAPDSYWDSLILPALDSYFDEHMNLSYNLLCDHSWGVNQLIAEGKADIGITCLYVPHPDIKYTLLYEHPFVLACHPDLFLPLQTLTPQNINAFPLIYCNWGDLFHDWFNETYRARAHFLELEKVFMFKQLLLQKKGVGFIPQRIIKEELAAGKLRTIGFLFSDSAPKENSYIIYRKKKDTLVRPIAEKLLSYALSAAQNFNGGTSAPQACP